MNAIEPAVAALPRGDDDLRALAWVHDELRRSLEAAHKALRRHLNEAADFLDSDLDRVDPAILRQARLNLHQGAGALELIGLSVPAQVLRASESAVQRIAQKPGLVTAKSIDVIERVSFALLDYLGRLLAGKPVSAVALFPQYRAAMELAGADRVHPADLWVTDWSWRELPADQQASARSVDAAARTAMEALLLPLMRAADKTTLSRMSDLCAELGAGAQGQSSILWKLGAAFFEAQAKGLVRPDVYTKRMGPRLLAQARAGSHPADLSERLAHDLLFFCARAEAPNPGQAAPRLDAVRRTYALEVDRPGDYEAARLGRFDPAWMAQARKRVSAARDIWSAVAGGDLHRLPTLVDAFALVGESLQKLYASGDRLAGVLSEAAVRTVQSGAAPPAPLAMEVATSILYLEASLEDGELDHPELAERVLHLAERIERVGHGAEPDPLAPWMEELYRRVSDRQTMGSVVHELRATLSEVEKQIDQYFRDPTQREVLIPVPAQLSAMRGVLSVLGLDQASHAIVRIRDDVDALAQTEVDPQLAARAGTFDRLADNLGALSFLIDMLVVQPQMAKSLFRYDADSGSLRAVMGRSGRGGAVPGETAAAAEDLVGRAQQIAQAAADASVPHEVLSGDLGRLSQQAVIAEEDALADTMASAQAALTQASSDTERHALRADLAQAIGEIAAPVVPPPPPAPQAATVPAAGEDDEMRGIFFEEAREVIADARSALGRLMDGPEGEGGVLEDMTVVRRAFHTLKGSGRMVGLTEFGEAAWACEQLYNSKLAQTPRMDRALRDFTTEALGYLGGWVEALAAGRDAGHRPAPVRAAADALRVEGRLQAIGAPQAPIAVEPALAAQTPMPALAAPAQTVSAAQPEEPLPEGTTVTVIADEDVVGEISEVIVAEPLEWPDEPLPSVAMPEAVALTSMVPDLPAATDLDLGARADAGAAAGVAGRPTTTGADTGTESPEIASASLEPVSAVLDRGGAESSAEAAAPEFIAAPVRPEPAEADAQAVADEDEVKVIEGLRIDVGMFNVYLNEADELSRRLSTAVAEWATEPHGAPGETAITLAHSLAGSSATVGYAELSALARTLEHALMRSNEAGDVLPGETDLYVQACDELRRLLHQFAAGFLRAPDPALLHRLQEHRAAGPVAGETPETLAPARLEAGGLPTDLPGAAEAIGRTPAGTAAPLAAATRASAADAGQEEDLDVVDQVDADLFQFFADEADDLLPQLHARMHEWLGRPADGAAAAACMRTLHTFKGGARLAGAMRVGEMAHRLETAIEHVLAKAEASAADVEPLLSRVDSLQAAFEQLRMPAAPASPEVATANSALAHQPAPEAAAETEVRAAAAEPQLTESTDLPHVSSAPFVPIDWSRFSSATVASAPVDKPAPVGTGVVRVRSGLLDRLVNEAGEVSIARARIEGNVGQLKGALADLTENLERLRGQLRDIEGQAETQLASRLEAAKAASQEFDPLEMDRYTRVQELTRMMAESVNDVATVHRTLQRALQSAEDELAIQARMTRALQDDLLRTRMVEFESLSDRLYRVIRMAAKETGKQVRLDIAGGSIEIDRGVLERMTGPFEHLLRNAVVHGVEPPSLRQSLGKDPTGEIRISLVQEGNEVGIEFADDGAGLDLDRIRQRAVALGLIAADEQPTEQALSDLIFHPGFSTASGVTELAGRGVGMDVVRSEVVGMGGRIVTSTRRGQGSRFKLVLPLTTAVTQVVLLRCDSALVAVPSTLAEHVRRISPEELGNAYEHGSFGEGANAVPFYWLGALLQGSSLGTATGRATPVLIIRSAAQRVALHVDEVIGNQEVVVKNLGPQLSHLPGLAGMTLLPSGVVAPIYNPVALAALYGQDALERQRAAVAGAAGAAPGEPRGAAAAAVEEPPLVLVVDDSLTVRRVTQRLLTREGYRVTTAKDGLDAIDRLAEEKPALVLSDIEMPRMDGFDLVRNLRADPKLADLPVIMITSRIAQKHRDYAAELGVDHYLGKPYAEEELLALVARYCHRLEPAPQ